MNEETIVEDAPVTEKVVPETEKVPEQGMKEEASGLVDKDGQNLKKVSIPVVKYKDYLFPVTTVTPEYQQYIGPEGAVRPLDIIKELRLTLDEMRNKFTLLSAGLALVAKSNPDVDEFLKTIGLTLSDLNQKQFYPFTENPEE